VAKKINRLPTPGQQRVLDFIKGFIFQHGYSPTFAEIRSGLEFASINSAIDHVNQLKKKGYLVSSKTKARSLIVLDPTSQMADPRQSLQSAMADLMALRGEDQALVLSMIRALKGSTQLDQA
jgi:SOS-response transcriptional repressor LexA